MGAVDALLARPALATARLTLSPPTAADRAAVVALAGDFAVARWLLRVPHPYSLADADAWLAMQGEARYAIRPAPDAPLIGTVGIAPHPAGWELGYWLGAAHWGRGYATEAAGAVLAHAAAIAGRPPLVSGYFDGNEASAAVLRKLGFVETGRSPRTPLALGREVTHVDMIYAADRPPAGPPATG